MLARDAMATPLILSPYKGEEVMYLSWDRELKIISPDPDSNSGM
jgi:hypothetical protein